MVPLDDSLDPHLAVRTAFSLAERTECAVSLASACVPDQADAVTQSLGETGDRFADVAPHTTRILDGPPVEAVLGAAPAGTAMICMPTHARAGLSRLIFGSVAEDLIRQSTQPILCVGPDVTDVPLPKEKIEILVCTDNSSASSVVFDAAAVFAEWLEASCVVSQVVGPDEDVTTDGGPPPAQSVTRPNATANKPSTVSEPTGWLPLRTCCTAMPQARSSKTPEVVQLTFIVVGTSGRTGLARHTLGSVAAGVVRNARCPVLVVPTLNQSA